MLTRRKIELLTQKGALRVIKVLLKIDGISCQNLKLMFNNIKKVVIIEKKNLAQT